MKWFFLFGVAIILVAPASCVADGMFVMPKFVWDKHKDINEPTQKAVIVYDAGQEDLILQVKYEGPVAEFGWLIPVPNLPTVQKGSMKCFYELSQYTQKHFERERPYGQIMSRGAYGTTAESAEPPVKVIEVKTVGTYDIAVLATKDSGALEKWLAANGYFFPTNKADVLNDYIQRQCYFIAVKIKLGQSAATANELASGELSPLQISFASDRCIFPLEISSVNGRPSEVQVYVLSSKPLLEKRMLEKNLPVIYSNDLARAVRQVQVKKAYQAQFGEHDSEPMFRQEWPGEKKEGEPEPLSNELLPFAKITEADLPNVRAAIPRLAGKPWWLTKQTWTFQPEEMRDLTFEPARPVLAGELDSDYGYYAAASLAALGKDGIPTLIQAMTSPTARVRLNAAEALDEENDTDPRVRAAAIGWLKDSEPKVRITAVQCLHEPDTAAPVWNPDIAEALVPMLRDEDAGVRLASVIELHHVPNYPANLAKFIPEFQQMLKDGNPDVRASGLIMLSTLQQPIKRADLVPFFSMTNLSALEGVVYNLRRNTNANDFSDQEAMALLKNPVPFARLFGLRILYQNANKQSVELALPLLNDPYKRVRVRAAGTLCALSGQDFTEEQVDQWQAWWAANKDSFVVQLHPEKLYRQRQDPPVTPEKTPPNGAGGFN